jgi:hypothetical protein
MVLAPCAAPPASAFDPIAREAYRVDARMLEEATVLG